MKPLSLLLAVALGERTPRLKGPRTWGEVEGSEPTTRPMRGACRPLTRAPLPQPW